MHLKRQDPTSCSVPGQTWFACNTQQSSFHGCCWDNFSCGQQSCPETTQSTASSSSSAQSTSVPPSSTPSTAPQSPAGTTATATVTVTPQPSSTLSSISSSITASTTSATVHNAGAFASVSSSTPASTQSAAAKHASESPFVPILAGTVSGVVVLSILAILVWFCLRRRKQKHQVRESIARYGLPTKDYVLDRSPTPEARLPKGGDVFAEFGGRHKSPTPASSSRPAPLARSVTDDSMKVASPIDAPIPDPEKCSLTPPPVHEHPAYHALPGDSPEIPAYHPGQPIHSPPMTQHPAYHISQLSQHPAFLSGPSPSPSPRHSTSTSTSTTPKRNSGAKRQRPSGSSCHPIAITELEADVPSSYVSPMRISTHYQYQYNPQHYAPFQNMPTRTHTQAASPRSPIGLGLGLTHDQAVSPQSPFHLAAQYQHHLSAGTEKEVAAAVAGPERWSGATCAEEQPGTDTGAEMAEVEVKARTPVSAAPSEEFRTWESWARR